MRTSSLFLLPLAFVLACGDKDGEDSADSGDTEVIPDGVSPQVLEADAHCYLHATGDETYFWTFSAEVTDPQGDDDIPTGFVHDIRFLRDGNVIEEIVDLLACRDGACSASFQEAQYGIPCTTADDWTVRFTVYDHEANSGSLDVQAYQD